MFLDISGFNWCAFSTTVRVEFLWKFLNNLKLYHSESEIFTLYKTGKTIKLDNLKKALYHHKFITNDTWFSQSTKRVDIDPDSTQRKTFG